MTTPPPPSAPRRSLAVAAAVGGCVGLAIGSAYVAGALARATVDEAQARSVAGAGSVPAPPAQAAPDRSDAGPAPASPPAGESRLTHVDLRGPVAPPRDLECLSQAVYYEARGEAERGRQAVAQVVMNRTRQPRFPRSICGVVFQHAGAGCAFAFACDGQTRHALEPAAWRDARRVASRALAGFALPELHAATDFRSGGGSPVGLERVAQIGAHVFYRWTGRWTGHAAPAPKPPEAPAPPAPSLVKADAPLRPPPEAATPAA